MATFTPSLSGVKGRALFSLLFMAPLVQAADNTAAQDGETLTVTADPNAVADATNGYQPLNTSTATLTNMPMLDIPQVSDWARVLSSGLPLNAARSHSPSISAASP